MTSQDLEPLPLPEYVSSNFISCRPLDLTFHYLSSGDRTNPLVLLLHGFPDISYSWRKVIAPLAQATKCYVVAPDQRGCGRTTGWEDNARSWDETVLSDFSSTNLAFDLVAFVRCLGYDKIKCVVGHDFGAVSGSALALIRPELVEKLVLMSHPFKPPPKLQIQKPGPSHAKALDLAWSGTDLSTRKERIERSRTTKPLTSELKHYRVYNSTPEAIKDWEKPPQGLKAFLREYLHVKSATFPLNASAGRLASNKPQEMSRMPFYYIMPLNATMPSAISDLLHQEYKDVQDGSAKHPMIPKSQLDRDLKWLPEEELEVYASEWGRTGFTGGLAWYRARNDPDNLAADWAFMSGLVDRLTVPLKYISGKQDWGNWQEYGAFENMENGKTCEKFRGTVLIDGAGHWVQQEKHEQVIEEISKFVNSAS